LPGANLTLVDGREEVALLLVAAPDLDRRAAEASARVVVGRVGEPEALHLLFEDDRVVDGEAATAILPGRQGIEPAPLTEPAPELALQPVLLRGGRFDRRGGEEAIGDIRVEEGPYLLPEALLFGGVLDFEVHTRPPVRAR
jgi:hypothetical protein